MLELILARREEMYQQNEAEVRKRWNYEDAVRVCIELQCFSPVFKIKSPVLFSCCDSCNVFFLLFSHSLFQIKRPYFHVKPLDRTQLKAWHTYLEWEMVEAEAANAVTEGTGVEGQEGSEVKEGIAGHRRVQILFERCLIACALYEEFWDKVE